MKETVTYNEPTVHRMVLRFALVMGFIFLTAQLSVLLRINLSGFGLFVLAAIPVVGLVGVELVLEPIAKAERIRNLVFIKDLNSLLATIATGNAPLDAFNELKASLTTRRFAEANLMAQSYPGLQINPEMVDAAFIGALLKGHTAEPSMELRNFAANIVDDPRLPTMLDGWEVEILKKITLGVPLSRIASEFNREPSDLHTLVSGIFLRYLFESRELKSERRKAAKQED
jgi:hypothetical protein